MIVGWLVARELGIGDDHKLLTINNGIVVGFGDPVPGESIIVLGIIHSFFVAIKNL